MKNVLSLNLNNEIIHIMRAYTDYIPQYPKTDHEAIMELKCSDEHDKGKELMNVTGHLLMAAILTKTKHFGEGNINLTIEAVEN